MSQTVLVTTEVQAEAELRQTEPLAQVTRQQHRLVRATTEALVLLQHQIMALAAEAVLVRLVEMGHRLRVEMAAMELHLLFQVHP